jgi:hypothetical protein
VKSNLLIVSTGLQEYIRKEFALYYTALAL